MKAGAGCLIVVFGLAALLAISVLLERCSFAAELPNPKFTPGAINPAVTQSTIRQTICVPGWTKTIRPPAAYTTAMKKRQIAKYADKKLADYEEDHLISLQLGGSPTSEKNLWPQAYAGNCGARKKDVVETKLKRLICSRKLPLRAAQKAIADNWVGAYRKYVGPISCGAGV